MRVFYYDQGGALTERQRLISMLEGTPLVQKLHPS